VVNATTQPLYPQKRNPEPISQDTGWDPGLVQTGAESRVPTRIRSPDHPVCSYLLFRPAFAMGQLLQVFSLFCQHLTFARTADYIPPSSYFTYDHLRKWSKGKIHPKTGHEMYNSILSLTSELMGWVVNATPRPLYLREKPATHCIGGWVGPRAGLER
jgi:hypothetical protein